MIRKANECDKDIVEGLFDGDGVVITSHYWHETEMGSKTRLCASISMEPGASVGYHEHVDEEEVFIITKGKAEVIDDGTRVVLNPGDTTLTGNGAGHSIANIGDTTLEFTAIIMQY